MRLMRIGIEEEDVAERTCESFGAGGSDCECGRRALNVGVDG